MYAWRGKRSIKNTDKPWGKETCWSAPWGTKGKIIEIENGHRTSLKYYPLKNECLYCLKGQVKVLVKTDSNEFCDRREDEYGVFDISEGEVILIMAGMPYRFEAVDGNCVLFEVVSGDSGNNAVMLEDDYGRL